MRISWLFSVVTGRGACMTAGRKKKMWRIPATHFSPTGSHMAKELTRPRRLAGADSQRLTLVGNKPAEIRTPVSEEDLFATIQDDIIPRLMLAHAGDLPREEACADARLPPTPEEIAAFAQLSVDDDLTSSLSFVEQMCAQGLTVESILLDLVAAAARLLGEQWLADDRPFTEVTAGLCTLQKVVHVLGPSFAPPRANHGFVVLVAVQPEQHTLGIYLLGEFLRRAGWGVHVAPAMTDADLLALVRDQHVEMVGITVSNTDLLGPLELLIRAIKQQSSNREIVVMVGGPLPLEQYGRDNGATVCSDPRDVVRWLDQHLIGK